MDHLVRHGSQHRALVGNQDQLTQWDALSTAGPPSWAGENRGDEIKVLKDNHGPWPDDDRTDAGGGIRVQVKHPVMPTQVWAQKVIAAAIAMHKWALQRGRASIADASAALEAVRLEQPAVSAQGFHFHARGRPTGASSNNQPSVSRPHTKSTKTKNRVPPGQDRPSGLSDWGQRDLEQLYECPLHHCPIHVISLLVSTS